MKFLKLASFCAVIYFSLFAHGLENLRSLVPEKSVLQNDLNLILKMAKLENKIEFNYIPSANNFSEVICLKEKVMLQIQGNESWGQVFYMTLQRLGFYFPHPRMQLSPRWSDIRKHCDKKFQWKPAVPYAGFHFHTLHGNEWVHGFLMGEQKIAEDTIRWLARNQQNIFDFCLLRMDEEQIFKNLKEPLALAKQFGIHAGVVMGMALNQQRILKLIPIHAIFFDGLSLRYLENNLKNILNHLDVSFIDLKPGTSEFTPTNYRRSILWMNKSAEIADQFNVATVVKVHVSSNQKDPEYGNFNFLPQFSNINVGILPHTLFLYGLEDANAPMYGNKNFQNIRDFALEQKDKRRTWFYPETSYYLGMDIDVPLLLTNYLLTRSKDLKFLNKNDFEGQLNFSTGQENGYWLFDWSTALANNTDYQFDPMTALKLLGEDLDSWKKIIDFQNEFFIQKGLISILTFSDFGSEMMPSLHQVIKRNLLKTLSTDHKLLKEEISQLEQAQAHLPLNIKIKNPELSAMWEITRQRISHALNVRKALLESEKKEFFLEKAAISRIAAQTHMNILINKYARYPEAMIYDRHENPTAYQYGYGYTTKDLYYWRREEEMVRKNHFEFYFMSLFGVWDLLRGWIF